MGKTRETGRFWPDAVDGPWEIICTWAVVAGRAECVGISVMPRPDLIRDGPSEHITTTLMRSIPFGEVIDELRRVWIELAERRRFSTGEYVNPELRGEFLKAFKKAGKVGRPPLYGPDHFEDVARVYREAFARGDPPTLSVADHWTVSKSAAAKWVARCRELGLLARNPGQGRPGVEKRSRKPVKAKTKKKGGRR